MGSVTATVTVPTTTRADRPVRRVNPHRNIGLMFEAIINDRLPTIGAPADVVEHAVAAERRYAPRDEAEALEDLMEELEQSGRDRELDALWALVEDLLVRG